MLKKMLIVDDAPNSRAALASLFAAEYTIACAENGTQAKEYMEAAGDTVSILLLDSMKPQMQGIEFLKWISASPYQGTPILAVTAEAQYQNAALQNGAWDVVAKPVEPNLLKMRVNNVLLRHDFLQKKASSQGRKAADQRLEETHRQMVQLVNSIPGGIATYRMTDRFETLYFSDGVAEMLGYTRAEYLAQLGQDAVDQIYRPDRERLIADAVENLKSGKAIDEACRIRHKDGHLMWVHLSGLPTEQTPEGILIYAVLQEISPQTRLYQSMLNETQTAVYACDSKTYEILYFNRKMAQLTGVQPEAVRGKKCYEHFFHRTSPCPFCRMEAMSQEKSYEREFSYPGGQGIYLMKGKLVDWSGVTAHIEYIEDITEKKRAEIEKVELLEQESKNQQLRYGVAVKSAGINVWEYDIQNDLLTVVSNSSRIQQNCYTISHYIQSTVERGYVREDSLPAFYSIFERLKAGEKEVTEDIWYKTTDEAGWWCERVIYTAVFDDDGVPVKAFGAGRDVTREKEAVRKFQEEMNYRAAIQGSSVGSMKINLTQNKILEGKSTSPIVSEWIRLGDADRYFANNAQFLTNGQGRENYLNKFNRRALIKQFQNGEFELSAKVTRKIDGKNIRWLKYNVNLMKKPESNDVVAFIAAHDITDEEVMKMIMDTVAKTDFERVVVVNGINNSAADYSTDQKGRAFSPEQQYEAQMEVLVRKNVAAEDVERVIASCKIDHILSKIEGEKSYKINYSVYEPNGELCRKQLQFTLMHKEQKTFLMTRIDVNEVFVQQEQAKQRLQEALRAAQSAANAKTEFLSRMSHDMRTPMNGIIGLTRLSQSIPGLPQEMQDNLSSIEDSGKYLLSLINDTLDMNKIESNKITLHYEVVNAERLVKNIFACVRPLAEAKEITLEYVPIHAELAYIRIDRIRVEQIFVNVLSNAIKFTPNGGRVRMEIECLKRENGVAYDRISVEDNGIGMSEEFLPKAFEPFAQENTAITTNYAGTGLGLSIVKNLIERMGGTIQIESKRGKGTKVTAYLNIERVYDYQEPQTLEQAEGVATLNGKRILLCEDHPLNAQIAKKLLTAKGMLVTHAENGKAALELLAQSEKPPFDAVLMDIRMPVMDGLEATRQIRKLKYCDDLPIIAMTANAFDTDRKNSRAAGMTDHLAKPIEPEVLYETLAKYIQGGPAPSAEGSGK